MTHPCPYCPLRDPSLIARFCDRACRMGLVLGDSIVERLHQLGNELYRAQLYDHARDAYEAACGQSEEFQVAPVFNWALCLVRLEDCDGALEKVDQVIEHYAEAEAYYLKGYILKYLRRWDEAEQTLRQAAELGDERAESMLTDIPLQRINHRVQTAGMNDDPEIKLAMLKSLGCKVAEGPPALRAEVMLEAGEAAERLSDFDQARQLFAQAYGQIPSAKTAQRLAEFLMDRGTEAEWARIESLLRTGLRLDPDCARAHYSLGRLWRTRGQPVLALKYLMQAIRKQPTEELLFETAEAAFEAGNLPHCLMLLQRIESARRPDPYWLDRVRQLRRSVGA